MVSTDMVDQEGPHREEECEVDVEDTTYLETSTATRYLLRMLLVQVHLQVLGEINQSHRACEGNTLMKQ